MRPTAIILCLLAASGSNAQTAPDCAGLTQALAGALGATDGYTLTVPPAGPTDGWCVLDGATLRSTGPGRPNLSAERFRLRRDGADGQPRIEIDATGLRVLPVVGDASVDERLRALFRLQTADLSLDATQNETDDRLEVQSLVLRLSGGTELKLSADIRGADLAPASLIGGSVTRLDLQWRSDGRVAGPVMEMAGEAMVGVGGGASVDAARGALSTVVAALPEAALSDDSRAALVDLVADLPQGRGKLRLSLSSQDGIGAARIAVAALSGDPFGPEALAALFKDARINAVWEPGLAP